MKVKQIALLFFLTICLILLPFEDDDNVEYGESTPTKNSGYYI